ncbi:sigma-70 family RNA polymerase sigma factor [Actinotalea ferrariae]|uniref:RNA polymerase sigma factor n=1 Tax=Actinotalea ferrariae TaxID=1386098 RepID=UPI001C8CCD55|nr:sigma-70 family RNA polymerase sigma factor [Actinotalea ferrariae]MBX9244865.1 sigma-70 family RNA polymerase sigma factor [Actinotalea ferrariae]
MNRTAGSTADGVGERTGLAARAAAAVVAFRDGRTGPLEDLVREATPLLWNVVRSQGVERDEAADVVQGVWLAFVRSAPTIREADAALKWLVVSARRAAWQAVAHRRGDARRTTTLEDEGAPYGQLRSPDRPPDEVVAADERDRRLWRRFLLLPERCQQVLRFVAMADRPDYRAIAEVTGMQVTAVGVTRGRCLAKLRALLATEEGWDA